MAQPIEESLFQAIKKDDIKAFNALAEKARCGAYRLGRFPVLSLLYLYKSRKILSEHEQAFLKITSFTQLREPVEISKKFSQKAGKCLRLYLNEVVSPLEMLLVLDKTRRLKRIYPLTKPTEEVKGRLKSIYSIKYSLGVKFEGNEIIIDRRPLSYREKKTIATVCLCAVLGVTVAVGLPVTVVSLIPEPVEGEVKKFSQIDFASAEEYTLKRDIVVPDNFSAERVNCNIIGGGNKLILKSGVSLGILDGKLSDLIIESSGEAVFTTVTKNAVIENVTVNVKADLAVTQNTALFAVTNYGTIDGVTLNVSGKITANKVGEADELTLGGIVFNNAYTSNQSYGEITNCTVNYSQFVLAGEASANAAFGGIAGVNNGVLQSCTVTGEINADTFDIAGVCVGNNGLISENINEANLSQTSSDPGWNSITSGIVIQNANIVEYCENKGNILAESTCAQPSEGLAVSAAGIVYLNSSNVGTCANRGVISAAGGDTAYAGGIAARSYGRQTHCFSGGEINVNSKSAYAGGILGCSEVYYSIDFFGYNFVWGTADYCISESKINSTEGYVGGIVGRVLETGIETQDGTVMYFGGGVTDCYFTGECVSEILYFGNIAGVCGANIYESNSYTSGFNVYHNFDGNYYADNSHNAFGAIISAENEFASAEDKGAAAMPKDDIKNLQAYKDILSVKE